MPVNLFPIYLAVVLLWIIAACLAFRWRAWAGTLMVVLTSLIVGTCYVNTGVRRQHFERMRFEIDGANDDSTVLLITSRGDVCEVRSARLVTRLRERKGADVPVFWTGTYDFGR